jgi:hypothetical protein
MGIPSMVSGTHKLETSIRWKGRKVGVQSDLQQWQKKLDLQKLDSQFRGVNTQPLLHVRSSSGGL